MTALATINAAGVYGRLVEAHVGVTVAAASSIEERVGALDAAWMLRPGPWPTLISAWGRSTRRVNRRRTSAFHSPPPERKLPPDLAPTAQASLTTSWGDEQAA